MGKNLNKFFESINFKHKTIIFFKKNQNANVEPEVQQLRSETKNWFDQINQDVLMMQPAFMNLPLNLVFVLIMFHSLILNEPIDTHKDLTLVVKNVSISTKEN